MRWAEHACAATPATYDATMRHLRLTHPDLDFWIDVRLRDFGGRWLAVADLANTPEMGMGDVPEEALRGALAPFGPHLRERLIASARELGPLA